MGLIGICQEGWQHPLCTWHWPWETQAKATESLRTHLNTETTINYVCWTIEALHVHGHLRFVTQERGDHPLNGAVTHFLPTAVDNRHYGRESKDSLLWAGWGVSPYSHAILFTAQDKGHKTHGTIFSCGFSSSAEQSLEALGHFPGSPNPTPLPQDLLSAYSLLELVEIL